MKRISFAFVLALVGACQNSPELSTKSQALEDCLPNGNFCDEVGQPLPAPQPWQGGALTTAATGSTAVLIPDGQGGGKAYGIDKNQAVWAVEVAPVQISSFIPTLMNAGYGLYIPWPPQPCCQPIGQDRAALRALNFRLEHVIPNAQVDYNTCGL